MLKTLLGLSAALFALAPPAPAEDFFVDAVSGDDANDGLTPGTAFRTISRASLAVGPPVNLTVDRVLVAPGRYDASIGETFPIRFDVFVRIEGTETVAGDRPVIAPGQGEDAFELGPVVGNDPLIERVTVQGARRAFLVRGGSTLSGVVVEGCSVAFDLDGTIGESPSIRNCTVRDCTIGVDARRGTIAVVDSSIVGADIAIRYRPADQTWLTVNDSRISECREGIEVTDAGSLTALFLRRSLIVDCATGLGLRGSASAPLQLYAWRATLAGNGVAASIDAPIDPAGSRIERSIVALNGVGFSATFPLPEVRTSIVDDGSATGAEVVALDPQFVDAGNGDYSLRRTSFAVDRFESGPGESLAPDGDLDGRGSTDLGALERETMRALTAATIGGTVTFEAEGQPGSFGVGLLDRDVSNNGTVLSPFGALFLAGAEVERAALVAFPPQQGRATWSVSIPNDPGLAGSTWYAQTLVRSQAAPLGAALTNPVTIEIE